MSAETPAYILLDTKITDPVAYEDYKAAARPIVESFGGIYLTRGGAMDIVQAELWEPTRIVLIKFPSRTAAHAFLDSPEYAPIKAIRLVNSATTLMILEGI
jgi:uncharacterized protein (DUF1330 family)